MTVEETNEMPDVVIPPADIPPPPTEPPPAT